MKRDTMCTFLSFFIFIAFAEIAESSPPEYTLEGSVCDSVISLSSAQPEVILSSPNFPDDYPNDIRCSVTLKVPSGHTMTLYCSDFSTSFRLSFFFFFLGDRVTLKTSLFFWKNRQLYGDEPEGKTYTIDSDNFDFIFRTDGSNTDYGFSCQVSGNDLLPTVKECPCGKVLPSTKIVGGVETKPNEFPFAVLLTRYKDEFFCGGALVNSDTILIAAHCITDSPGIMPSDIKVGLEEHDLSDGYENLVQVKSFTLHPDHDPVTSNNDFAFLKLETPISFEENGKIAPVCLPVDASDDYVDDTVVVMGWGLLSEAGTYPDKLQKVSLDVVKSKDCRDKLITYSITSSMICAAGDKKDACSGDSGGPMVKIVNDQATLVGTTSFGSSAGCAYQDFPGVYSRTTSFLGWLKENNIEYTVTGGTYACI